MKPLTLFDLLQSSVFSVYPLHSFVLGFSKVRNGMKSDSISPRLEYLFYVLPIVYHKDSMTAFRSSNALMNALKKNKYITLGLQERANRMSKQTFDSLNVAFSKNILGYDQSKGEVYLMRGFSSVKMVHMKGFVGTDLTDLVYAQDAAHKLGTIFAKRSEELLENELNIRF
jgi:hypothetical protein